ncbi:hypothetical protein CDJ04_17850 [Salmonella enterica]|nr:hypothetical protein [Salmonella enterica]
MNYVVRDLKTRAKPIIFYSRKIFWKIQIIQVHIPCKAARLQGCKAARLQGCKAARLQGCKANPLKSTRFTLSFLVIALFLSSPSVYAAGVDSYEAGGGTANGDNSVAIGDKAQGEGENSIATGKGAYAKGEYSIATGSYALATGENGTATGSYAQAAGEGSTATGSYAQAAGEDSTATGNLANATGIASTATGSYAQAAKEGSTATGYNTQAAGEYSTATGVNTLAKGKNSVALGANSRATHDNEVNIGVWSFQSGSTYKQTGTRTLSGLADGVNADEAVNKGQLDKVKQDANTYTDKAKADAIAEANKYTDNAALEANDKVLKKANTYTDDKAEQTLKSANDNTERRAVVAEKRSQTYTDERSASTLESANTYTNHRAVQAENNAVARSNNYTDNRFGELRKSLEHTEKRLNAGIAGVTALSSIPYSAGNEFSYGIGAGNYQNGNAVAAGVQFRVSPSTNVRLNISWDSAGNNATGVGIAGGW